MKRKIGILGGTFDPPHLGHLIIANEVLDRLGLDEVRFMPNHEPPHKERHSGTSVENRLDMLERAIDGHPKFSIETIELNQDGRSYTYDTMKTVREKNPDNDYFFIIGADMVEFLPHWYNIEELVKLVQFVGANRPNYKLESPYPVQFVEVPMIEISSSMIRDRVKKRMSIKYLLPDQVIRYIEENHLYET
ncbi:nicotinate-nucleotide adenylyltransferase [Siminovitchia fortis]|uniref:Probable nicotinate-nucleotide adenylyltransferase n=1 Tax=Siminovitchia fortis TaxID=254758 RepID=A0A443J4D9_9BACI|nr:nicotinate-nucleotide adenylyltransferase [Siminovitchia fortis]RWR15183.1 nicotinate-nucleotide adenylyltransferase [Siminovitchia fortis]WHY82678.1 nicotinate-nucleotide adenylyltransferase [Siminovitchia fortis]